MALAYRPDVDGLRAVAILAVMTFHLEPRAMFAGSFGVDIFFVISGFLITRIVLGLLEDGRWSYSRFVWRRVRRLSPALAVVVIATLAAAPLIHDGEMVRLIAQWGAQSLAYVINFTILFGGGEITQGAQNPFGHTWSLAVEMHFYALWPVLLWALHGRTKVVRWAIAGVGAASFLAAAIATFEHPFSVYLLTPFRVYAFALGAFVALSPAPGALSASRAGIYAGLATFVVVLALYSAIISKWWMPYSTLIGCVGVATLIWLGERAFVLRQLARPVPVYLGKISYALYLVHWPILALALSYLGADPTRLGMGLSLAQKGLVLGASLVLAVALHHGVERPLRAAPRVTA